jgi:hypothetical protein
MHKKTKTETEKLAKRYEAGSLKRAVECLHQGANELSGATGDRHPYSNDRVEIAKAIDRLAARAEQLLAEADEPAPGPEDELTLFRREAQGYLRMQGYVPVGVPGYGTAWMVQTADPRSKRARS